MIPYFQAPMQALDTVAPQAFGAGNLEQVGIACQRAVGFALLLLVPVAVLLWSHAEQILIALGQEPAVAAFATRYLLALSPALPVLAVFESARRFLYAPILLGSKSASPPPRIPSAPRSPSCARI